MATDYRALAVLVSDVRSILFMLVSYLSCIGLGYQLCRPILIKYLHGEEVKHRIIRGMGYIIIGMVLSLCWYLLLAHPLVLFVPMLLFFTSAFKR